MIKSFGIVTLPVLGDSIKNSPVSNISSSPIPTLGFHSFLPASPNFAVIWHSFHSPSLLP